MQENFDSYNSMRISEMPKVEAIVMPTGGSLGRCRRADDLRRGPGGAQRLLRGNRKTYSLGSAEKREDLLCMTIEAAAPKTAASFSCAGTASRTWHALHEALSGCLE